MSKSATFVPEKEITAENALEFLKDLNDLLCSGMLGATKNAIYIGGTEAYSKQEVDRLIAEAVRDSRVDIRDTLLANLPTANTFMSVNALRTMLQAL